MLWVFTSPYEGRRDDFFREPSRDEVFIAIARDLVAWNIDKNLHISSFEEFILAASVVIENSKSQVSFILNDMSFRDIVNRWTLNKVTRDFLSRGWKISIEVLRQATEEIRKKCRYDMFDASSNAQITINRKFPGIRGDIIIADDNMSVYTNPTAKWIANFWSVQLVQDLQAYKNN